MGLRHDQIRIGCERTTHDSFVSGIVPLGSDGKPQTAIALAGTSPGPDGGAVVNGLEHLLNVLSRLDAIRARYTLASDRGVDRQLTFELTHLALMVTVPARHRLQLPPGASRTLPGSPVRHFAAV